MVSDGIIFNAILNFQILATPINIDSIKIFFFFKKRTLLSIVKTKEIYILQAFGFMNE